MSYDESETVISDLWISVVVKGLSKWFIVRNYWSVQMGKLLVINCEMYLKQISLPRGIMLFLHCG